MGMYDNLRCLYPLPVEGANAINFQTNDTPAQALDTYEIREDGTLWHEDYDVEDQSDPNAEGIMRLVGCATSVNQRWVFEPITSEIRFYGWKDGESGEYSELEFSAYFVDGKLRELHRVSGWRRVSSATKQPIPQALYRSKIDPDILLRIESVIPDADNFFVAISFLEDEKADELIELAAAEWDAMRARFQLVEADG